MSCYDSLMVLVAVWQWSEEGREEEGERKLIQVQKLSFNEDRSCSDVYFKHKWRNEQRKDNVALAAFKENY